MTKPWIDASKTICIDYDGCLNEYDGAPDRGNNNRETPYPPRPGAREFLRDLHNAGYIIVIFTAADVEDVKKFLIENEMWEFVYKITNEKIPAIIYVDDRGLRFEGNFAKTYHEILSFVPYWERGNHNGKG
jgi:hydroxymethylpyrimidine pyrophosphatase-like HAD family hydrolase